MPSSNQYQNILTSDLTATIESSGSLSSAINLSGTTLVGYIMPSSWTSADITFQASADGSNFYNLYDQFGNEAKHTVSSSRFIALNPSDMASLNYIKLRSGTNSLAVSQSAQRVITLVTRPL